MCIYPVQVKIKQIEVGDLNHLQAIFHIGLRNYSQPCALPLYSQRRILQRQHTV